MVLTGFLGCIPYPNKYGLVGSWANSIEPSKRMLSSMTPTIVEDKEGDLFLVVGSPGGSTIITTVAQIISNIIDYNMPLKDAVDSPRTHHQWLPDKIFLENKMFLGNYGIQRSRSLIPRFRNTA